MKWKTFFKPTKWTGMVFVVLVILVYLILVHNDLRIFPCQIQPVIPNPPEFISGMCGLGAYSGISKIFTLSGYILIALISFVLPYIISCTTKYFLKN